MGTNGHNGAADRRAAILAKAGMLEEEPAKLAGEDVLVRELSGAQAHAFEVAVAKGVEHVLGYLLQMSLVDPDTHELIFTAAERGTLEEMGFGQLRPLVEIATRLSGLSDEDIAKAKASLLRAPSTAGT